MPSLRDRIRIWTNACADSTDLKNVKDALEKGEKAMAAAELSGEFMKLNSDINRRFGQAREAFNAVGGAADRVLNGCQDLRAAIQIQDAIGVLDQKDIIMKDPTTAARAFGDLFAGAGRFAEKLPPPAGSYPEILKACGNFFTDMDRLSNLKTRPSTKEQCAEMGDLCNR